MRHTPLRQLAALTVSFFAMTLLTPHTSAAEVELPYPLQPKPEAFKAANFPDGSATPWNPSIQVIEVSDHVLIFYDGRDRTGDPAWITAPGTWTSFDSGLGTGAYVVHDGAEALVLDSLWTRSQGEFIRSHMEKNFGIKRFTLALSHWHLDHIGGNGAFADVPIISSMRTAEVLEGYAEHIRAGTLWGPPAMPDLTLPNTTFNDRMTLQVGSLPVHLEHFNIHSDDHILVYLPTEQLGLVGDMTEDTVPVISHPEGIPQHLVELERLRAMPMKALYPDHGNPTILANGGYDKRHIDAAIEYERNMLLRVKDPDFLEQPVESFVPEALAGKVVSVIDAYRSAHRYSQENVIKYWKERPLPKLE